MGKDVEYVDMKRMIANLRNPLLLEEILGDKSAELERNILNNDNAGKKITLDSNVNANIISDSNEEADPYIVTELQKMLNGFIDAVQGTLNNIEIITVHLDKTIMRITINVMLIDDQPASLHISSENTIPQLKYDNFLALTPENVKFIMAVQAYFNKEIMQNFDRAADLNL